MNTDPTLVRLLEGWLDGGLSDAEQAELLRQLDDDEQLRRRFAGQVAMLGATRAAADANPRWLALFDLLDQGDGSDARAPSFEAATMGRIDDIARPAWRVGSAAWGLAAVLMLLLAGGFLMKSGQPDPTVEPLAGAVADPGETPADADLPVVPAVAVVLGGSAEAAFKAGTGLKPGVIAQNSGWLTLQTFKGVSVTFDAPFEVVLSDHDRIRLNKGQARVHVPPGAEGFRLESPAFDVVDLGTEFAARVNPDGTGTCRVFDGEADVSLLDSVGEVKRTQRLSANKSVQILPTRQALEMIEEQDEDYPEIKLPPRPKLELATAYAADVMRMAPLGYWRFESISNGVVPNEVAGGARLQAAGSASIHPEVGGNHSGELTHLNQTEFFQIPNAKALLQGDFSISMFAQFEWLQNFALISCMRYDDKVQGHPFLMQSYAAFRGSGKKGTALHAVFRDPPGWVGGVEVVGNTGLRPHYWHHVAATRSNHTVTLYVDGVTVAQESVGSLAVDCREIFIGRLNGNPAQDRTESRGLVGRVDELAIFPRALTAAEIRRLGMPGNPGD